MYSQVLRRTGGVLLAVGFIGGVVTIARRAVAGPCLAVAAITITAGIALLWGGPRAALWIRTLAVFLLAAGISALIAGPFYQPLDLTITQIRLDQGDFAVAVGSAISVLALLLWVTRELGRPPVLDAIASARITRWDMRMPAQAGSGVVILACLLLWLMLHGQTAELATSLAFQQLGPDYRYHLSWISNSHSGHGTSVTGIVTAWNHKEIKTVLLHWETP
jgi:hypothetical protein